MHRLPRNFAFVLVLAAAAAGLVLAVSARGRTTSLPAAPPCGLGLVGGPRAATPAGQRMIVILKTPSVAERLAKARFATESQER